jgi:small-conductance mechanosensitive channel
MMSYTLFRFGPYEVCLLNLIALFVIFFVAYVLRKFIQRSMKRYLIGVNISLEGRNATLLKILAQSVYLLAGYIAILSFGINNENVSFKEFLNFDIIQFSKLKINFFQIIFILVTIVGGKMLINLLKLYYNRKFRTKSESNSSTEYVYGKTTTYIIYMVVFFLCLQELNINPGVFLGGSAALLVGIGLGLQDVFKDWVSGLILLYEGSMKIGDIIEIGDAKFNQPIVARILKINVRTTEIETRDGNVILIPNAKLTQEYVENWSHSQPTMRFRVNVVIGFNSDTELAVKLIRQAALSHPKVNKREEIMVRMQEFSERGLELELLFWADQTWESNNYKSEIRFEIDRLFRQYNVTIPVPNRYIQFPPQNQGDGKVGKDLYPKE